jgi:hypothetical protein
LLVVRLEDRPTCLTVDRSLDVDEESAQVDVLLILEARSVDTWERIGFVG